MLTIILKILYNIGLLRKSQPGVYYCDPEVFMISRICFTYIPMLGKSTDDIKTHCGDWHRMRFFKWEIEYLTYTITKTPKNKIKFP